jgi:hypothetical protein
MKRSLHTLMIAALAAPLAYAQPAPPVPDGERPPRGHDDRREGPGREGHGLGMPGRDGSGRDGPPGGPRALGGARPGPLEQMKNFLEVINRYNELGKDADASAVAAVINAIDILRPRGGEAVITRLEKMLGETKSVAAQRVIRLQLADFYRQTNQADKALEQLDVLIKG